jgi:hypothetical protein
MNTDIENSLRTASPLAQSIRELIKIIGNNKSWTVLAALCTADGIFAIIDLSIKPGFLTTCPGITELKACQLNALGIAHVLGWTIVPPVFFFIETLIKRSSFELTGDPTTDAQRKAEADRLKAMQEMGGKIWAAVLAAILFLAPK